VSESDRQRHINLAGSAIAIGLVVILAGITAALVFLDIPDQNQNNLTLLIGNLVGLVGLVVGFYFGSSSDTKKLVDTAHVVAKTAANAGAAGGSPDTMTIPLDTTASVTTTDDGAVIRKEPEP
jgi:hypothetical protein